MSMTKDDRLQIRVGPAEKRLLERAAAATHVSVSAFVVQSAAARAATALADAGLIIGEKRGRWVWWSIVPERLTELRDALAIPAMVAA
jgi:DNA-binding transcriptional ArsR family regulator